MRKTPSQRSTSTQNKKTSEQRLKQLIESIAPPKELILEESKKEANKPLYLIRYE